jgi:hypothetical protein
MLAVRAQPHGFEIEFTQPLKAGKSLQPSDFLVQQWWYKPTKNYGGPKMDLEQMEISQTTTFQRPNEGLSGNSESERETRRLFPFAGWTQKQQRAVAVVVGNLVHVECDSELIYLFIKNYL